MAGSGDPSLEWLKAIGTFTLAIVGLLTFIRAVIEYRAAQKWRRAEFLANETRIFFSDPVNRRAMFMLDWDGGRWIDFEDSDGEETAVEVGHDDIVRALSEKRGGFSDKKTMIRDTFSDFFDNLARFEQYLNSKLFTENELRPYLSYWMNLINQGVEIDVRRQIFKFLDEYKFDSTIALLKRFEKTS